MDQDDPHPVIDGSGTNQAGRRREDLRPGKAEAAAGRGGRVGLRKSAGTPLFLAFDRDRLRKEVNSGTGRTPKVKNYDRMHLRFGKKRIAVQGQRKLG